MAKSEGTFEHGISMLPVLLLISSTLSSSLRTIVSRFGKAARRPTSSRVASHLKETSQLECLYSARTALISSGSSLVRGTVFEMVIPPLSFFLMRMLGGFLLSLIPNPSSSRSMIALSPSGLSTSRTMKRRLHDRATADDQRRWMVRLRRTIRRSLNDTGHTQILPAAFARPI